jgi:hypothetical protein
MPPGTALAWPPPQRTSSVGSSEREEISTGRRPRSSERSAMRAERFDERTAE